MHTHEIGLRMQAYVCALILAPRNPKSDFLVSFALFVLPNMRLF